MSAPKPNPGGDPERIVLFLQGVASPFFAELGRVLRRRGHGVRRINLSLGDRLVWPGRAVDYRGKLPGWREFLSGYLARHRVTDIVLFGDCRPYHRVAIFLAAHGHVQVHVFEEGYFRPYWITVEQGGVNGYSSLPRDPDEIRRLAMEMPETVDREFPGSFFRRACWDVGYNAAALVGRAYYRGFKRHRPEHILIEYGCWLRRFMRRPAIERHARAQVRRVASRPGSYVLVPPQLESDYQIRVHSRFGGLVESLDEVMAPFAQHAPPGIELVVKVHPLDPGLIDHPARIAEMAARHGLAGRVATIEAGHLPTLLRAARGVVVVNSTVGTTALETGRPTIALGRAVYDVPGLTFQDGLDRFWTEGVSPDEALFRAFRRLVMGRTQVNGGFFTPHGVAMAVETAADRIVAAGPAHLRRPVRDGAPARALPAFPRPQPAE